MQDGGTLVNIINNDEFLDFQLYEKVKVKYDIKSKVASFISSEINEDSRKQLIEHFQKFFN